MSEPARPDFERLDELHEGGVSSRWTFESFDAYPAIREYVRQLEMILRSLK